MSVQTPEPVQEIPQKSLYTRLKELSSSPKQLLAKRPVRLAAIIVGLALVVAGLGWWGWSNSSLSKLSVDAALTEGTVQYRLAYDDPWENAQEGMSFGEGAHIRTLDESRAVLQIDDGSAVRLNANSSVVLTKLTAKHIIIENTGGDIYTRVFKSTKRAFQVRSGSTIYQSLGTAYRIFNTNNKEGVEVYQGKVTILGIRSDGSFVVSQGKRYFAVNTTATDLEGKITELSITELAGDEFLRWNSEQDRKDFAKELGLLFDLTPPSLEITAPLNGFSTEAAAVEVIGKTEKDAKISINGVGATNNEGTFTTTVNLHDGANSITVEATDKAGNKAVKDLTVIRTMPTPKPTASITLSAKGGSSVGWTFSGNPAPYGYRLVWSTAKSPTYPSSDFKVYEQPDTSGSITNDPGYYYVRICAYNEAGGECKLYSNEIYVRVP